jgi:hypothetical protein
MLRASDVQLYKISRFSQYRVDDAEDFKRILYQLLRGGPLLTIIKISENRDKCYNSDPIYKFNPNTVSMREDGELLTHVFSVISFVLKKKV